MLYVIKHGHLYYTDGKKNLLFVGIDNHPATLSLNAKMVVEEEGLRILAYWKKNNTVLQGLRMKDCYLEEVNAI